MRGTKQERWQNGTARTHSGGGGGARGGGGGGGAARRCGGGMYETHWLDLVRTWRSRPAQWRRKVQDEVLNGKGVPPGVRGRLWLEASGAAARIERFPGAYAGYVAQAAELIAAGDKEFLAVELQIRKDVRRTYPLFLRKRGAPAALSRQTSGTSIAGDGGNEAGARGDWKPHERSLYNVLCAVSLSVDQVRYHQGLNYVSALLLLTLRESAATARAGAPGQPSGDPADQLRGWEQAEEGAFWVLFCVLNDYHLRGIYEHKSSFLQQYMDQFELLVRRFLPRLHRHLELGLQPSFPVVLFAIEWFTTAFTYSLRIDSVYLAWDLFLVCRLDEALFTIGLALLHHLADRIIAVQSFEAMVHSFKHLVAAVRAKDLRESVRVVVQRIVPSALIPPGRSTLANIEREMHDASNLLNTADFDATPFMRAVQLGDARTVSVELNKYRFPTALIEQALLRAAFLGSAGVAQVLVGACDASCRHSLNRVEGLTPLHIAALMGHPTVARVLLAAGVDRSLRCSSSVLQPFFASEDRGGYTPQDLARACAASENAPSAVLTVLEGGACLACGRLLEREAPGPATGAFARVLDALRPDWPQAAPRAHKSDGWAGDYCVSCSDGTATVVLDAPLDEASWHCRHCRAMLLGERVVTCQRCLHAFCGACAFTRRRLLPKHKQPVDVCANCHHFLRSCPCQHAADAAKGFDVLCDHAPTDYMLQEKTASLPHVCECAQCLRRRYALKAPLHAARPAMYDPTAPLYPRPDALLLGFWGLGERSVLGGGGGGGQEARSTPRELASSIEDFVTSRLRLAADEESRGAARQDAAAAPAEGRSQSTARQFRDFRAELVEFYSVWNPSQLGKVDSLLAKYSGKEEALLDDLQRMYCSSEFV